MLAMAIGCAHYGDGMCSLWRWDVFTMAMGCAHYGDGMCSLRRWDALTMALFRFKRQINWAWCHKSVMARRAGASSRPAWSNSES